MRRACIRKSHTGDNYENPLGHSHTHFYLCLRSRPQTRTPLQQRNAQGQLWIHNLRDPADCPPPAPLETFVGLAIANYDGQGNLAQTYGTSHGSINGGSLTDLGSGTYSISEDCSGTMVLNLTGRIPAVHSSSGSCWWTEAIRSIWSS